MSDSAEDVCPGSIHGERGAIPCVCEGIRGLVTAARAEALAEVRAMAEQFIPLHDARTDDSVEGFGHRGAAAALRAFVSELPEPDAPPPNPDVW